MSLHHTASDGRILRASAQSLTTPRKFSLLSRMRARFAKTATATSPSAPNPRTAHTALSSSSAASPTRPARNTSAAAAFIRTTSEVDTPYPACGNGSDPTLAALAADRILHWDAPLRPTKASRCGGKKDRSPRQSKSSQDRVPGLTRDKSNSTSFGATRRKLCRSRSGRTWTGGKDSVRNSGALTLTVCRLRTRDIFPRSNSTSDPLSNSTVSRAAHRTKVKECKTGAPSTMCLTVGCPPVQLFIPDSVNCRS
mmetsp:Transcript_88759/g.203014  ORF Transcript_88759/g.203014 Transcript_88759/m.203014 type:complete len:253 (-) Transcript_88759:935-1693(-)